MIFRHAFFGFGATVGIIVAAPSLLFAQSYPCLEPTVVYRSKQPPGTAFVEVLLCFQLSQFNAPLGRCDDVAQKYVDTPTKETGKTFETCLRKVDNPHMVMHVNPATKMLEYPKTSMSLGEILYQIEIDTGVLSKTSDTTEQFAPNMLMQ